MRHTSDLSAQGVEVRRSEIQRHPQLQSKFEVRLRSNESLSEKRGGGEEEAEKEREASLVICSSTVPGLVVTYMCTCPHASSNKEEVSTSAVGG